jgi:4-methyl-5(b-hydroxyethyl)-thiazole monophosphate biosynthesis
MKRVLVPLAPGCEETEAVTIIDLLRRAEIQVVTAGLDDQPITASRGVRLLADATLDEALNSEYDMVVLPGGGPGAENLNKDPRVHELLKRMVASGKFVGAICAAPQVLASAGLLAGRKATSFPGALEGFELPDTQLTGAPVERDGQVVTSRGPGTAMDFALELIEILEGPEKRQAVEGPLQRP